MVPRLFRRLKSAFQVRQCSVQHWSPMSGTVKARAGFGFGMFMTALRTGVVVRNCPLVLAKHIDAEALLGMQVGMGAGAVIHADQHQHGIERHGSKRISRHAVNLAVEVYGDDRHPGGEGSHGLAEFGRIQGHFDRNAARDILTNRHSMHRRQRRSKLRLYGSNRIHYHARRCIIRGKVALSPSTLSRRENNSARPVEVCPGEAISREDALQLLRCPDSDLPDLLAAARAAKERFKPGVVTYSRKVFIPLTTLCRDYCGYCTFRRDPGDPGGRTMDIDEVVELCRSGEKLGVKEALFSL